MCVCSGNTSSHTNLKCLGGGVLVINTCLSCVSFLHKTPILRDVRTSIEVF